MENETPFLVGRGMGFFRVLVRKRNERERPWWDIKEAPKIIFEAMFLFYGVPNICCRSIKMLANKNINIIRKGRLWQKQILFFLMELRLIS